LRECQLVKAQSSEAAKRDNRNALRNLRQLASSNHRTP
jgi:hypothetical protein